MATILVYTTPAAGHLFPIMDTLLDLRRRGHNVTVRTLSTHVSTVLDAGLAAKSIAAAIEERRMDDWRATTIVGSVSKSMRTFLDRARIEIDDVTEAIKTERPDLLLIDTNAWGARAAAERSGLPWAVWHPFPMPLSSPHTPPFGPGLTPANGRTGRIRDQALRPLVARLLNRPLDPLNRIRTSAGAPPLTHIDELYTRPPLTLYLTAEPFEYQRPDWPETVQLVGPGLWSPPSPKWPAWRQDDRPIVLVTCSTEFQNDRRLLASALAAFGDDPNVQLVCSTGGIDPSSLPLPDCAASGVVMERFLPHDLVLTQTAVVICHGGMGITQRSLAAGVPVVAVPFGRDQHEVARRVVESGAGVRLPPRRLSAKRLRDASETARSCSNGVAQVQAGFEAAGGHQRAADLVEHLLTATT